MDGLEIYSLLDIAIHDDQYVDQWHLGHPNLLFAKQNLNPGRKITP